MYTDNMRRAFHAVKAPKGFTVQLIDNDHFLTLRLDEMQFMNMHHDQKIAAVQYVINLKKALEMEGAIVLVAREAIK